MPTLIFETDDPDFWPCPEACGGPTDDPAGGPCTARWGRILARPDAPGDLQEDR